MIRVAVLYGGTSGEHEVSVVSAASVLRAIDRTRYEVVPVAIGKDGRWILPERAADALPEVAGQLPDAGEGTTVALQPAEAGGALLGADPRDRIDVVFPVLHGRGGEDGTIQGFLSSLGVPYVGAGVAASAVGMDKSLQKPAFAAAGIPVTPWITVRASSWEADPDAVVARAAHLGFPCFTKPASEGSSIGVSRCADEASLRAGLDTAFQHDRVALVETGVVGRELECAILGNEDPQASVVGEIIPVHDFYDYEAKYLVEGSRAVIPAEIPDQVAEQIRAYAIEAFAAIGCSGMARVDFFLADDGAIYLNEINTIPGFTPISMYPKLWEASGVPYTKLIDRLIELALQR
jgi:D-alanine-D-alanine ligase